MPVDLISNPNFWKVALALAAPVCLYLGFRNWRLARLIDDTPRSRVRSAAQGYVELGGRARMPPDTVNSSPLTGRPCVWWLYRIERAGSGSRGRSWEVIDRGVSSTHFVLEDEADSCLVNPEGADVRPSERTVWYGAEAWPTTGFAAGNMALFGNRDYRYTEHRIQEYELVNVIGDFRTLGGIKSADVTGEVIQLLAEWKKDQPELLQRFDVNRDGVLNLVEWEAARTAARRQIEQQPPQPSSPDVNVLARPQDDRPFLIAAGDLRKVAWRSRLAAAGLIVAFLVAVGSLATLLLNPG
jgi:hypothetical protein